jgi:hypothetical protein
MHIPDRAVPVEDYSIASRVFTVVWVVLTAAIAGFFGLVIGSTTFLGY